MRNTQEIINDIHQFEPQEGNWLKLEDLLNELWETGFQQNYTNDLLKVFERFPKEDGAGVFWTIVHGIEGFGTYELQLINSLYRQPSEMGIVMLTRIKKIGAKSVGGIEINKIITDLLSKRDLTPTMRKLIINIDE